MFCGAALRGSDLAAALRPRGHNKCAALWWAAAAAAGTAGAEAARMMSRRSRGRNSTHDVLNYSNPGKESWSGHGAFRGARRRRRGLRLRRPLTRRGAAYKYWRTLGRRKMDRCGNLRALWGGLIDVLVFLQKRGLGQSLPKQNCSYGPPSGVCHRVSYDTSAKSVWETVICVLDPNPES